jgi:hypothetical protein
MVIDRPVDVSAYTKETRGELIERVRNIIIGNVERFSASGTGLSETDRGKGIPSVAPNHE